MTSSRYSTVSHQSWFSRLRSAFTGILVGIVLVIVSIALLFWNEGRSVERYKTLKEGEKSVVSIPATPLDPARNGQLVHLSAMAETDSEVRDVLFGVSVDGLKLRREVEMYQWIESTRTEERKKMGGGTETITHYEYNRGWNSRPIDSQRFHVTEGHENPTGMPVQSDTFVAHPIKLGDFILGDALVNRISGYQDLELDPETLIQPDWSIHGFQREGRRLFLGQNPSNPAIGDLRFRFTFVPIQDFSVVAQQQQNNLVSYTTQVGGTIALLGAGVQSAETLFAQAHSSNRMLTWLLRLGGFILMGVGWSMIFRPLSVIADVIPIVGSIIGAGTGVIAFLLSGVISLVTISIAWLFFRPILGIILLIAAIALVVTIVKKTRAAKATQTQTVQPDPAS